MSGRRLRVLSLAALIAFGAAHTPARAASDEAQERPAPAGYLKLHPDFIVNLRSEPGDPHMLLATVEVMSRNPMTLEGAGRHIPALRHHMVLLLTEQAYPAIRAPDAQRELQGEALEALNEVLAAELGQAHALEALYFTNFVIE